MSTELTQEQRDALREIDYAHDEGGRCITDVFEFVNSGDIGWNQSSELSGIVRELRVRWDRMEKALTKVRMLIEPDEQPVSPSPDLSRVRGLLDRARTQAMALGYGEGRLMETLDELAAALAEGKTETERP